MKKLLAPSGKFVLSIDKNQDEFIDIGTSKIKVYPDKPSDIEEYVSNANLKLSEHYETEFAHILQILKADEVVKCTGLSICTAR